MHGLPRSPQPPAPTRRSEHSLFAAPTAHRNLKRSAVRGVAATLSAQVIQFVIGVGSTAILARLLTPVDFGLVAMTTVLTGFVILISDGGLALATVQREHITHEQVSTLFWVNVSLGFLIGGGLCLAAPAVAVLYKEERLTDITRVLALSFVFSGFAVQHRALMRRQLRFKTLAVIDLLALVAGVTVAVTMATQGFAYWSLVGMSVTLPVVSFVCVWLLVPWRPSWPRRGAGVRPMLRFGSDVLSFNVVSYLKSQADLMLIGLRWGPMAVGFYEKAVRMLLLPVRQVNLPLGAVLVPALSRLVSEPARFARFYLRALELLTGVTIPLVFALVLFSDELVNLWLGSQWMESARLFRFLAFAALIAVLVNPVHWLLVSLGQTQKNKWIGITTSAIHVLAFVIGLPAGPAGVAIAYSTSHLVLCIPVWITAARGTPVPPGAVLRAFAPSLLAAMGATAAGVLLMKAGGFLADPTIRAAVAMLGFGAVYALILLGAFGRWRIYVGVIQELNPGRRPPMADPH